MCWIFSYYCFLIHCLPLSTSLSSLTGRPVWADLTGLPVHPGSDLIRPVGPQDPDWSIEEAGG